MNYLIAFYESDSDFAARDGADDAVFWPAWRAYFDAIHAANVYVDGQPLQAPARAATVRNGNDGRVVHDGPYADTKEQLGGFVIVDVASLDEALAWAKRAPCALTGAVEVRPVLPMHSGEDAAAGRTRHEAGTYVLAIYESSADFGRRNDPAESEYWAGWGAFTAALTESRIFRGGTPLRGPETATVVRTGTSGPVVHDGPYADTKEQLGGYIEIDVPTLEDALQWAARCPAASSGAVEVRPILPLGARV